MKEIQSRIHDLEQRLLQMEVSQEKKAAEERYSPWRILHEIQTIPCTAGANDESDMVLTHKPADASVVFVAPFKFTGKMFLRRMSMICSCTAGNTTDIGFALYALDNPQRIDRSNPLSGSTSRLRRVHKGKWIEVTGTGHSRLDITFPPGFVLDSSKAIYYAGWTIADSSVGKVFCPNATAGVVSFDGSSKTFNAAFRTNGSVVDFVFPDNVTISGPIDKPVTPCVVARSEAGIRAYGSFTDDV